MRGVKLIHVIAIVDQKDLDGKILVLKNHVYKAFMENNCNKLIVFTEQGKRTFASCLFKIVE